MRAQPATSRGRVRAIQTAGPLASLAHQAPCVLRQRIEHCQLLAPEDLPRFAEIGVACSVQFSHAPSDRDLAERFWPDRLDGAYAFRSLLGRGTALVFLPKGTLARLAGK